MRIADLGRIKTFKTSPSAYIIFQVSPLKLFKLILNAVKMSQNVSWWDLKEGEIN